MGFLDKILSKVGRTPVTAVRSAPAAAGPAPAARTNSAAPLPFLGPSKAPAGPLRLAKGDFVTHYRRRFAVTGLRVLEGDGATLVHYCLRDANGAAAVLVAEGGPDPACSLQRFMKGEVRWDADEVTNVPDGPFRIVRRGKMKVRSFDDAGTATGARSVEYRSFADPSGDRVLALEDYQGKREVRLGEPVFEAEMEFERKSGGRTGGARTAALGGASAFEDAADDDIAKGTPRAAAKSLEENMGASKSAPRSAADRDPTAYDDDAWADAVDAVPAAPGPRPKSAAKTRAADDDEEWVSATQLVRENGEVGGDEDEYDESLT